MVSDPEQQHRRGEAPVHGHAPSALCSLTRGQVASELARRLV